MGKIRVLIADDYPMVRQGLRTMLSGERSIEIVGEASNGVEALAMVAEKEPNIVLMDIRMPDMDGIEATRQIKEKYPSVVVIVLSMHERGNYVIDAVQARASGYLLKDVSRELLLHTIQNVSSNTTLIKTDLLCEAISSLTHRNEASQEMEASAERSLDKLTPRENEVLKLVMEGCTYKEIGREFAVAEITVKQYMRSIRTKLDATNRAEVITKASLAGIMK